MDPDISSSSVSGFYVSLSAHGPGQFRTRASARSRCPMTSPETAWLPSPLFRGQLCLLTPRRGHSPTSLPCHPAQPSPVSSPFHFITIRVSSSMRIRPGLSWNEWLSLYFLVSVPQVHHLSPFQADLVKASRRSTPPHPPPSCHGQLGWMWPLPAPQTFQVCDLVRGSGVASPLTT